MKSGKLETKAISHPLEFPDAVLLKQITGNSAVLDRVIRLPQAN